jgi:DnaJ-class molecular chaperone
MAKVWNKSTLTMEEGTRQQCPRCKGFGALIHDEEDCYLCAGQSEVWRLPSGWSRPVNSADTDSTIY